MKFIIFLIIIFSLSSCGSTPNSEMDDRLESLTRMKIHDNSSILYAYSYAGSMAWSSSIIGQVLIDSTDIFSSDKIKNRLTRGYITNFSSKSNRIDMIRFISDYSDVINNGMFIEKSGDFTIYIKQYYNKGGANVFYHFNNLSETDDSVFFDKIYKEEYGSNLDFKDRVGFRKGNIVVEEDSLGFVSGIRLDLINQNPLWEELRKKDSIIVSKSFNGINKIDLPPLSKVYIFHIELKPDSFSSQQKISDFGVYKRIK